MHCGVRRSGKRTRAHGETLGEHALLEKGIGSARLRHRRPQHSSQRDSDYAHHHRRRQSHHGFLARTVQGRRAGNRHRLPYGARRQGAHSHHHDCDPHDRTIGAGAGGSGASGEEDGHCGVIRSGGKLSASEGLGSGAVPERDSVPFQLSRHLPAGLVDGVASRLHSLPLAALWRTTKPVPGIPQAECDHRHRTFLLRSPYNPESTGIIPLCAKVPEGDGIH